MLCHDKYQPTCTGTFMSRVEAKALLPFLPSGTVHCMSEPLHLLFDKILIGSEVAEAWPKVHKTPQAALLKGLRTVQNQASNSLGSFKIYMKIFCFMHVL